MPKRRLPSVNVGARFSLGIAARIGQAVQLAQLLLAAQPRVERLQGERAADAEDQAGEEAGRDRSARAAARRRLGRGGAASRRAGSGRPLAAQRLERGELGWRARRCCSPAVLGVLRARSRRPVIGWSASARTSSACAAATTPSAKPLAMSRRSSGGRPLGRDRDDVALRDRLGGDLLEQVARALVEAQLALDALGHVRCSTSRAAVSTSRVGSLDSRMSGRPVSAGRRGGRGDQQVGLGLVLVGGDGQVRGRHQSVVRVTSAIRPRRSRGCGSSAPAPKSRSADAASQRPRNREPLVYRPNSCDYYESSLRSVCALINASPIAADNRPRSHMKIVRNTRCSLHRLGRPAS